MTVQVPSENAEKVGLRRVIGEKEVGVVLTALTGVSTEMPKNWNRRFKHNRDKMKTGDILELAEVVRNLALRDREKGLSTGEKQMFVKAKKILASELMYAKDMDEETCAEWLEEVLASDSPPQEEAGGQEEGRCGCDGLAGPASGHVRLGHPRRRGTGGTARAGPAEGVREARRRAAPRRAAAPSRGLPLGGRDRPRRAAGLGGARDPRRRGGGLRQGARLRDGRRDAGATPCGRASPRCPPTRSSSSCTTRRGRCVSDEVVERVLAPLSEGWDGAVPGLPVGDTLKRVGPDGGVHETVSRDGLWAVQTPQAFAADALAPGPSE